MLANNKHATSGHSTPIITFNLLLPEQSTLSHNCLHIELFLQAVLVGSLTTLPSSARAYHVCCFQRAPTHPHTLTLFPAQVVLVGDPQQLPATLFSKRAKELLLERSLFERLQQVGDHGGAGERETSDL